MRFVFWQNFVSIHQSAFIKALSKDYDVTLVASEAIDEQRRREKWTVPSMGNARVVITPDQSKIDSLLDPPDTHHVFSGINAFPMIYKVFKSAVKRGLKVSVLAEPYEWAGVKGMMRRIMYSLLFLRYGRNISHFFTTGNMGVRCYRKAGFPAYKLHQWGYFTEQQEMPSRPLYNSEVSSDTTVKLIYVGRIDENKNIVETLKGFDKFGDNVDTFSIVGDGPLMDKLTAVAATNSKIKLLGRLGNEEVSPIIAKHDFLVLPSLYDGWGAVVNEALGVGTAVLCSEACGASILLDGNERGQVFSPTTMFSIIKQNCDRGPISPERRRAISDWATRNISGEVAAKYFVDIINGCDAKAPWV